MAEHYFTKTPKSEMKLGLLQVRNLRGLDLEVYTASGVFSVKKVDKGTWALIENMEISGKKVLDFGCGIGIVGIAYALTDRKSDVTLIDINQRAVKIARMNIKKLGIDNARALQSDMFSKVSGKFDNIISNPPISAGMEACYRIVEESYSHLNNGGIFQAVARHKKGGSRIMERMQEIFKNCKVVAKKGGYWIYVSEKTTD